MARDSFVFLLAIAPSMTPPEFFSDFGQKITEDGFSGTAAKIPQPSELGILRLPFGVFAGNAGPDFCVFKKPQFRALPGFLENRLPEKSAQIPKKFQEGQDESEKCLGRERV